MMDTNKIPNDAGDDPRGNEAADRMSGAATSAQTRDAARLRSMMGQGNDRPANPQDDLSARQAQPDDQPAATEAHGRPTTLRMPAVIAQKPLRSLLNDTSRQVHDDDADPATRLRSPGSGMTVPGTAAVAFAAAGREESRTVRAEPSALQIEHAGSESHMQAGESAQARVGLAVDPSPACAEVTHAGVETETLESAPQRDYQESGRRTGINETAFAGARAFPAEEPRPAPRTISYATPPSTYSTRASSARPGFMSRVRRPMLATTAVLAGTAIGVALYAGGGDLLSSIFSRHQQSAVTDPNPSAVTERPAPPPPPAQQEDSLTVVDVDQPGTNGAAPAGSQAAVHGTAQNTQIDGVGSPAHAGPATTAHAQNVGEARPAALTPASHAAAHPMSIPATSHDAGSTQQRTTPAVHSAESARPAVASDAHHTTAVQPAVHRQVANGASGDGSSPRAEDATTPTAAHHAAPPTAAAHTTIPPKGTTAAAPKKDGAGGKNGAGGDRYLVQVRATPDESEANLIAKRLKSKGASGIAIVKTPQKNGTTIYRVRYSATGTNTSAASTAARAGYKDVWVVKQK